MKKALTIDELEYLIDLVADNKDYGDSEQVENWKENLINKLYDMKE